VSSLRPAHFVAVVTGAGSGVGTAVARALGKAGCAVAVVGRRPQRIEPVSSDIRSAGGQAIAFNCDVSKPAAVDQLHRDVSEKLGSVNVLVNAAGVFEEIVSIRESDPARWINTLQINTVGPYLTCRAFMQEMIQQGWGRIINISSAASVVPPAGVSSAYQLSKVALNWFTRQLAAELDGSGVTANVMHPGEVKTEMWATLKEEAARRGKDGEGMLKWAKMVEETGGDPPEKTADLILKLIDPSRPPINGQFLWIADGMKRPMETW
jgi:NAD(P)-dependent dehydrogenase (short-subunit alcohol dehydrogenase family)